MKGTAMTSQRNDSPTRTLVLGGGGVVGVAWQTGLLAGLREAGVELTKASTFLGTSAGALVGALLSSGRDVTDALSVLAAIGQKIDPATLAAAHKVFLDKSLQASLAADPQKAIRAIGLTTHEVTTTLAEEDYLGLFEILDGVAWPPGFRCTAADIDTGDLVVFGQESGVPLQRAVAASCVVPTLFPTVTINGIRYMDGGLLSHLNATAAPPTGIVLVLSCIPLGTEGGEAGRGLAASTVKAAAEVAQLRETTRLLVVEADFSELGGPVNYLDAETARQALPIGKRQAEREAASVQAAWGR
jgi:NTE family protein